MHLRVRARELRVEAHIESRVEIDRVWAATQQAVQIGATIARAGSCWLERSVREVVRGEVERLEREHLDAVTGAPQLSATRNFVLVW